MDTRMLATYKGNVNRQNVKKGGDAQETTEGTGEGRGVGA